MPRNLSQVFVSATTADLGSYRLEVRNALLDRDVHPALQDHLRPDHRTLVELLREEIGKSDAVICLLGRVYGSEPKTEMRDPDKPRRSYTQVEYDIAVDLEKPVFVFVAAADCSFNEHPAEPDELRDLQQTHIEHVKATDRKWQSFRSVNELTYAVSRILIPEPPFSPKRGTDALIVPKEGLHAFEASDSPFFLQLLPGPRDQDGIPRSIRYWKDRIEQNKEQTFKIGAIYGPSGCGKSSLVKAGVLPCLSERVVSIYIEATPDETESRLLYGLRKEFPTLSRDLDLPQTIAALRAGQGWDGSHKKLVIVLDQFEQWLNARQHDWESELTRALQNCDGDHIQCIVMVREDFLTVLKRYLKFLNVSLNDRENAYLVDLFDKAHARAVLAEFGRAFKRLPDDLGSLSEEQRAFLNQVVDGLAVDGYVIAIRLAVFAEMLRGRDWSPTTLEKLGGMDGVGVRFLREKFESAALRDNQHGAKLVLRLLLPEIGMVIRGNRRSRDELMAEWASARVAGDFDELLNALDRDVYLITPTDPVGTQIKRPSPPKVLKEEFYQLTHDYLVPSLREWLRQEESRTFRGRARLRLADRSVVWKNGNEQDRYLPSAWEFLGIRLLTDRRYWTEPQQKMMERSAKLYGRWAKIIAATSVAGFLAIWHITGANHAATLVEELPSIKNDEVLHQVERLEGWRIWADPLLKNALRAEDEWLQKELLKKLDVRDEANLEANRSRKLRLALALLPVDSLQLPILREQLVRVPVSEFPMLRDGLKKQMERIGDQLSKETIIQPLWNVLDDPDDEPERRFRAACALATFDDPTNPGWASHGPEISDILVKEDPLVLGTWTEALRPIKGLLVDPLINIFHDSKRSSSERQVAAGLLADFFADDGAVLTGLLLDSTERQFLLLWPRLRVHRQKAIELLREEIAKEMPEQDKVEARDELARRQAWAAVSLLRLGEAEPVIWSLMRHSRDPSLRTHLIRGLSRLDTQPDAIIDQLKCETDLSIRRALILCLGGFPAKELGESQRQELTNLLLLWHRDDPDAGIHSACQWVLRTQLGWTSEFENLPHIPLPGPAGVDGANWYVAENGHTLAVITPRVFWMGSPEFEIGRYDSEGPRHRVAIPRSFAIATAETTVQQFMTFVAEVKLNRKQLKYTQRLIAGPDGPMIAVTWHQAALYCNWLSQRKGIPEDQWCYRPYERTRPGEKVSETAVNLADGYLSKIGYRLPTESEWEYACRGNATTSRYYGTSSSRLSDYAWHIGNSGDRTWLVGLLRPNDFGLFDIQGNATEWCQSRWFEYPEGTEGVPREDREEAQLTVEDSDPRVLRGGSYRAPESDVRSALRGRQNPALFFDTVGFRIARTWDAETKNDKASEAPAVERDDNR